MRIDSEARGATQDEKLSLGIRQREVLGRLWAAITFRLARPWNDGQTKGRLLHADAM